MLGQFLLGDWILRFESESFLEICNEATCQREIRGCERVILTDDSLLPELESSESDSSSRIDFGYFSSVMESDGTVVHSARVSVVRVTSANVVKRGEKDELETILRVVSELESGRGGAVSRGPVRATEQRSHLKIVELIEWVVWVSISLDEIRD